MEYCKACSVSKVDKLYHDMEWGVPLYDDKKQFEYLMMEVMQCGLSWTLMLRKREIFRNCFDYFDYNRVALYSELDIVRIINTKEMIRSERKIRTIIHNARCFQKICSEYGCFSDYLWAYSNGKTILYDGHDTGILPISNGLSETISRDLKKRGFKYLGSVTIYSYLQACGIINDHNKDCFRYWEIVKNFPVVRQKRNQEKF